MNKCLKLLSKILIIIVISAVYTQSVFVAGATNLKGYAIYSNGGWSNGHSGFMYKAGFDVDSGTETVLHVSDLFNSLNKGNKADFLNGNAFIGYYRPNINLTTNIQLQIINILNALYSRRDKINYVLSEQIVYDDADHNGKVNLSEVKKLRCDGLVEYAYEYYGIKIYGDESTWNISIANKENRDAHSGLKITPKKQAYDCMTNMLGDVDGNNAVNSADARTVNRIAAKLEVPNEYQSFVADVDRNGKINSVDAREILRFASKQISVFSGDPKELPGFQ